MNERPTVELEEKGGEVIATCKDCGFYLGTFRTRRHAYFSINELNEKLKNHVCATAN